MITYVDTSTLLKLVVDEDGSDQASTIWTSADTVASVVLIVVEARAALAAAKRGRRLTAEQHADARQELDALLADLHVVEATADLIVEAAGARRGRSTSRLRRGPPRRSSTRWGNRPQQCRCGSVRRRGAPRTPHRQPAGRRLIVPSGPRPSLSDIEWVGTPRTLHRRADPIGSSGLRGRVKCVPTNGT